ncbi:MAG: GTPase domain-containing protein [Gammaproteobacteria bacterium]|nr:GTPase domain-containing protein [Gammaproteobacteria bacterium]
MTEAAETEFLREFLARLAGTDPDPDAVFALRIAETGLFALTRDLSPVPGVAVVGPTQTGKSTVVNLLAGGEYVETSPLAAHTRHAAVLAVNTGLDTDHMPDFHAAGLAVDPLQVVQDGPARLIWDTPDFDSNAAAVYRQETARVCALADVVVVVVSREKYADQSVWGVLETIAALDVPTILCLNKCDNDAETRILVEAIRRRFNEHPEVVGNIALYTLPMLPARDGGTALSRVEDFRCAVFDSLQRRSGKARRAGLARLIRANWTAWVAPVEQELACQREWKALIADQTDSFLARYRSEYIDHSKHHDVAQKAILGLLELLEIPGLAGPLGRTRRVLTWPFRRLASALGAGGEAERDKELDVLDAAIDHYLLSLRGEVSVRRHPWWRALEGELAGREPELKQAFRHAVDEYRKAFQPRIDDLSNQLYARLQRNPTTLNALRATRVGADAGGIAIAFNTGTLGLYDALFAPAVVSLTSYLAESVVGQYLRSVIAGLKREQHEQVSAIIHEDVARPLESLQPRGPGLFGISRAGLERARRGLEALER